MARPTRTRSETIAAELRDDILRGQYRPGERLPSERDLAARHATSRGTVREAVKRLDQLGLADIQPGGARAAAVQGCSLDVLGPLLALEPTPDPALVDQIFEVLGVLMRFAAEAAVTHGEAEKLAETRRLIRKLRTSAGSADAGESVAGLFRSLADAADHLVLRLIMNGLRGQAREHIRKTCDPESIDPVELRRIARDLDTAIDKRRPAAAGAAIERLFDVLRRHAANRQASVEPRRRVAS
ncbi:MAG: GntR family transcriptional regulator [Gammaproteobacteria bacterium]|nr:GntR family transcriptional regulator [Gammaproteobacteria bacterium]MDH3505953.1 GntR family transcriptional regulator [Gammaproteobacteria bacterium]